MIFLSIIIPAYNSQETIIPLLHSIVDSHRVNFWEIEVIVVDDKSEDKTVEIITSVMGPAAHVSQVRSSIASRNESFTNQKPSSRSQGEARFGIPRSRHPLPTIKIIMSKHNQGPAAARNIGVKYAKGKVILFLDSDVLVYKDTLFEIIRSFKKDLDLYALTGVWDKKQDSRKFFPQFKALRDWSYWINERDPRNYYYLFSTRIAAINRELFLRLGGFDTTYKAALVEDMELTYRIARRYAIVFDPKVMVHHEFEDFLPVAKKYFWRSFYWSKIYRERKKFDPVATTGKEAMTTISAGGLVGSLGFWAVIRGIWDVWMRWETGTKEIDFLFFIICSLFFVIHLFGVRKFLWFCIKEEGIWFAVRSFFVGLTLYIIILSGAALSFLGSFVRRKT